MMRFGVLAALALAVPAASQTPPTAAALAQGAMSRRVQAVVYAYADRVGLGWEYIQYCSTKMNLSEEHAQDGSIPFGVNYNTMSADDLAVTIKVREAYEKTYQTLCLADAKNTLAGAAAK